MSMLSATVRPRRGSTGSAGAMRNMDLACGAFFCTIRVRMIGRCGDTMQDYDGVRVPEVRYLLERAHWHRGYAAEAAAVCRDYAFTPLGFDGVFSIIRDTNLASQRVAQPISMEPREMFVEHYYGVDMPHIYFSIRRM